MKRIVLILLLVSQVGVCEEDIDFKGMDDAKQKYEEGLKVRSVMFADFEYLYPGELSQKLAKSAAKGDLKGMQAAIESGASVNDLGRLNATPLFWALKSNNLKGFEKLLQLGADPNVVFNSNSSVMHLSVLKNDPKYLELSLKFGGDPNQKLGDMEETPLIIASYSDPVKYRHIKLLVDHGADLNMSGLNGYKLLYLVIRLRRADLGSYLLELGADCTLDDLKLAKEQKRWLPSNASGEEFVMKCGQAII